MISHVIFDMNGVIIDDEYVHEIAFQATVKKYGIKMTHEMYLACCAGRTDRAGFETVANETGVNLPIEQVLEDKSQQYLELFPKYKRSFPGVIALINKLKRDYILALTSSASRAEVEMTLKEFEITDCFKVIVTADDITKGKPDPEPYLLTAQKLHVNPDVCVVIEDSRNGLLSAKAAGMKCIVITTTHAKADLKEADLIVDSFAVIDVKALK